MAKISFCLVLLFSPFAFAQKWDNGYTEKQFNKILNIFEDVYSPIIEDLGGEFFIESYWQDGSVNAFAWREGRKFIIEVPGGVSRYGIFNEETFVTFLCHEMGHLLGGEPLGYQISYEGQSDYYSTNVCTKLIFPLIEDVAPTATDEIKNLCADDRICQRSLFAALTIAEFDAGIAKVKIPQFSTPDKTVVKETLKSHPAPQCRLDIRLAGALGLERPSCWYKSKD